MTTEDDPPPAAAPPEAATPASKESGIENSPVDQAPASQLSGSQEAAGEAAEAEEFLEPPAPPSLLLQVGKGFFLGGLFGIILVFLLQYLPNTGFEAESRHDQPRSTLSIRVAGQILLSAEHPKGEMFNRGINDGDASDIGPTSVLEDYERVWTYLVLTTGFFLGGILGGLIGGFTFRKTAVPTS